MPIRALLVWPGSRNEVIGWGDPGAVAEPLALEYLGAALAVDGHSAEILDFRLHPGSLARTLERLRPDLVGITAFSMHVARAYEIASEVKALRPGAQVIVGGHHATFLPDDFFGVVIDHVVAGEGIGPIRAVARAIEAGKCAEPCPGLYSRRDGTFQGEGRSLPDGGWGDGRLRMVPAPAGPIHAAAARSGMERSSALSTRSRSVGGDRAVSGPRRSMCSKAAG